MALKGSEARLKRGLLGPQCGQTAANGGNFACDYRWIAGHRHHGLTQDAINFPTRLKWSACGMQREIGRGEVLAGAQ